MSYFNDFPHTRNYDSDLGFLIQKYKELNCNYETLLQWYSKIRKNIKKETQSYIDELIQKGKLELMLRYNSTYEDLGIIVGNDNTGDFPGTGAEYIGEVATLQNGAFSLKDTKAREDIAELKQGSESTCIYAFFGNQGIYKENFDYSNTDIQPLGECMVMHKKGSNEFVIRDFGTEFAPFASIVIPYLSLNGLTHCKAFIISHYHSDHVGRNHTNLTTILNQFCDSNTIAYLPHGNINWNSGVWDSTYSQIQFDIKQEINAKGITIIEPTTNGYLYQLFDDVTMRVYNVESVDFNQYYDYKLNQYGTSTNYTNYNSFSMITKFIHRENEVVQVGDITDIVEKNFPTLLTTTSVFTFAHHSLNRLHDNDYVSNLPQFGFGIVCTGENYQSDFRLAKQDTQKALNCGINVFVTGMQQNNRIIVTSKDSIKVEADTKLTLDNDIGHGYGGILEKGTDLNNIYIVGTYNVQNATNMQSIANAPFTHTGMVLDVYQTNANYQVMQVARTIGSSHNILMCYRIASYNSQDNPYPTWGAWHYMTSSVYVNRRLKSSDVTKSGTTLNGTYTNCISCINGIMTLNFDITIPSGTTTSDNILSIPIGTNLGNASYFPVYTPSNTINLGYVTYGDNNVYLRVGNNISVSTRIRGSVAIGLRDQSKVSFIDVDSY